MQVIITIMEQLVEEEVVDLEGMEAKVGLNPIIMMAMLEFGHMVEGEEDMEEVVVMVVKMLYTVMVLVEGAGEEDMEAMQMEEIMGVEGEDILEEEVAMVGEEEDTIQMAEIIEVEEEDMAMVEMELMLLDLELVGEDHMMAVLVSVLYNIMHKELTSMNYIYIKGMCIAPPPVSNPNNKESVCNYTLQMIRRV